MQIMDTNELYELLKELSTLENELENTVNSGMVSSCRLRKYKYMLNDIKKEKMEIEEELSEINNS